MKYTGWERDAKVAEARAMYREGAPVASIAAAVGVSEATICRWCKDLKNRASPTTPDELILELGRKGMSIERISAACGANHNRVSRLLKANGIPIRKPGRQFFDRKNINPLLYWRRIA